MAERVAYALIRGVAVFDLIALNSTRNVRTEPPGVYLRLLGTGTGM
jgi:hypothetical protein